MAKYKVIQRIGSNPMETEEKVIDFEGSLDELKAHSHIIEAEVVKEEEKKKDKQEDKPKHK